MLNASMIAGMAFTNVSLGIVHSIAHTVGSFFHVAHGLADAVILPYIIAYNSTNPDAKESYDSVAKQLGESDMAEAIRRLNRKVGIAPKLSEIIGDEKAYTERAEEMAKIALQDGCTKTNPVIPSLEEMKALVLKVYYG
jgi:alcohol dehydrogenase class IV